MKLSFIYFVCVFTTNHVSFVEKQAELNQLENNIIMLHTLYTNLSREYNLVAFTKFRRNELLYKNSTLIKYSNEHGHLTIVDDVLRLKFKDVERKIKIEGKHLQAQRIMLNNEISEAYKVCINIMEILTVLLKNNVYEFSKQPIVEAIV